MQSVTYLKGRPRFRRVFRVKDLVRLGIPHKNEDLVFSPENRFTIVMSNKMSDSLVAAFPSEFKAYPAGGEDESPLPEVKEPMTSLTVPTTDKPEDVPEASLVQADDDVKSSRRSTRPGQ